MRFFKGISLLAALTASATTLGACGEAATTQDSSDSEASKVGSVGMAITLPDDSVVSSVTYTITGPAGYSRTGAVPVGDSTLLTFRIGGIPVGNGYSIALSASTSFSNSCMGSASFNVLNNATTRVSVLLVCGATDNVGDLIVDGEFQSCPIVTAAGAIPAEVRVGGTLALSSVISHGDTPVLWSGAGGTFATPNAYSTQFTCATVGTHVLTVAINSSEAACTNSSTVEVICSPTAGCGNGVLDVGEQCDDNNAVNTDACTNACRTAVCGDGISGPSPEECDDGNGVNTDACSNSCLTVACGNGRVDPGEQCDGTAGCSATCRTLGCGDGIVTAPETCDDSNAIDTDACTNSCRVAACGDGVVQTGVEDCDDGNTVGGDACPADCQSVVIPGDSANQITACRDCRSTECTNYEGALDLIAGCFADPDPTFNQQCIDLMNCAYANDCGYNVAGLGECFCGTFDPGACQTAGNQNGPCIPQVYAAARSTVLADVIGSLGATSLPVGVAFYLQKCDTDLCPASCTP